MNQCFETESGQPESVDITAIEGHSITKEAFEKATDEPNNKHENIPSKQPSKQNDNSDKNVEIIDLTEDQNAIGGLQNTLVRKRQRPKLSWSRDGIYSCKYCKQTYSTHGFIMRHVNEVHLKIKPYSCKYCKHSSARECDLAKHVKFVHLKPNPYECHKCESAFESKMQLKAHLNKVHLKKKLQSSDLTCQYCDKSFSTKNYVEIHTKTVHLKMKQFSCSDCGKLFTQKSSLNLHIKRHQQNRYNCDPCKIYFIQEKNLKQHVSETHKNAKPMLKWVKPLLPGPLVFINDLKNTSMLSDIETMQA